MKIELRDRNIEQGDICLDINNEVFLIVGFYNHKFEKFRYAPLSLDSNELYGDYYDTVEELVKEYELTLLAKGKDVKLIKYEENE